MDQFEKPVPPEVVADYLSTSVGSLAQMRYRGTGPQFHKAGRRVLYFLSEVEEWLATNAHTVTCSA